MIHRRAFCKALAAAPLAAPTLLGSVSAEEMSSIVIVSHRKMWTDFLVDDRALQYHYGTGPEHLIAVMGALLDTLRVIQERERLSRMEAEK